MIAEPPFAGALQPSETKPLPAVAELSVGESGTFGSVAERSFDGTLSPGRAFTAVTV